MAFEIFKLFGSIFVDTSEANNEMDKAGNNAELLGKKFGDVAKTVDNISSGLSSVGKGFSTYVTAPLTALGAASVIAFNTVDDGMDKIITTTGAMGAKAENLENVYKNVGKTIPDTFNNISSAVGDVSTRFNVTGDQLQSMSENFLKFSRVTGTDVATSVQLVSRAMGDAGIPAEAYKSVLDQLTKASQTSGISIETLTENLTKYGAPMRALGFDTQESIAIFAGWEKAGVNTEIAFSGMKKAISNWSADGKDAREEFKKTLQTIGETPDIATATSMAIEVFGQKAGPDLADAIKGGRFSYEEFLAVIEGSDGTLDNTFNSILDAGDKFQLSFQKMQQAGADLGETILNVLAPMLESAAEKVSDLGEWFSNLDQGQQEFIVKIGMVAAAIGPVLLILGGLAGAVSNVAGLFATGGVLNGALGAASAAFGLGGEGALGMGASLAALTGPVAIVIAVIAGLVATLVGAWQSSETFRSSVSGAFESIKNTAQDAFGRIGEALGPALVSFQGFATNLTPILKQIGDFLGTYIVPLVNQFMGAFINGFADIIVAIAPFITAIGNLFSFIGNFVGMVFALFNGDWTSAWGFAQATAKSFVDFLTNALEGMKNIFFITFGAIVTKTQESWQGIYENGVVIWNIITTFLKDTLQRIYDDTIGKLVETVTGIAGKWDEINQTAGEKWNEIKTNIINTVAGLPDALKTVAISMINKIVEGIAETAGNVYTAVTGLVNDIITKFKEGLGIASPAKELIEIGKYMIQGLIKGLNGDNLMKFVNNMIEELKAAFSDGNFSLEAAINFIGSGAAEFFKSIGIGGAKIENLTAPLSGSITSGFGLRDSPTDGASSDHGGIDIGASEGTPVGASGAGEVTFAGGDPSTGYGYHVIIDHGNGLETLYGHLSSVLVSVGEIVSQLETIGLVGSTGISTGPHLHFGVFKNGQAIDPESLFGLATGTNYIPQTGPYFLHKGEAVVPEKYNPAIAGDQNTNNKIEINQTFINNSDSSPSENARRTLNALRLAGLMG